MDILNSLIYMTCEMAPYILLGLFIAGVLKAFVPSSVMSKHLSGSGWNSVVKAAMIGIPLPLCSCGVLPTAVALRRNGASKAATTSFLISTPQTGVDSIAATWSLLGPVFAISRPIAALFTAVLGGVAVGTLDRDDKQNEPNRDESCESDCCRPISEQSKQRFYDKAKDALKYGFYDMVQSIGGWLVAGLIIAALITVLVPADFFAALGDRPLLAMIAVVIVAVPMYVCATGSIPIALSLMLKGLSPGTALVLLMAGPAANFASITILSKTMGRKSAAIYLTSIIAGAIAFGLAADYLMPREWFPLPSTGTVESCHNHLPVFSVVSAIALAGMLIVAFIGRIINPHKHNHNHNPNIMTKEYKIKGMNCPHCQKSVENAIASQPGVDAVSVNLRTGIATVEGDPVDEDIRKAVEAAGFDIE